ncbi:cytochrome P450 6k1-like [Chelonus insularis]|uniref:cytochrome P450 6k1-like n=1 Tax=Chelonus insularis TaxID=460826 RepID=UPI00158D3869|nr:cytochrome P450 6k1-like [Chelonus insularis]
MELLSVYLTLTFFIIISIFVVIFYFYSRYKLSYWTRRGIEQLPNPHIIFGHVKEAILARTAPGLHMSELYHSAKPELPYIGFYMFHKPCLLIRDPEVAKQLFVTDFEIFSDRHFAGSSQLDSLGMLNLFGINNPAWKFLRTKISPLLTKGKLKGMFPLMLETSESMVEYLENQPDVKKGNNVKQIDIQDLIFKHTIDSIANLTLETHSNSFLNPDSDYTKEALCLFHGATRMRALLTVFFMPEIVKYFGFLVLFKLKHSMKIFWEKFNARYTGQTQPRNDYLDALVSLKNSEPSPLYKFDGENLFSLATMIFSGLESSATAASFTLLQLAKNHEIQNRARNEITEIIMKHGWTMEAFNKMQYLEQCIHEGVRLYPPVSIVDRKTGQDYHIPNTDDVLEKGVSVFIPLYGMHSDERYFPDHKVYNPERFADGQKPLGFIGFGIGPRMCVGTKMGLLFIKLAISKILMNYQIYQRSEYSNELDKRGTLSVVAHGAEIFYQPISQKLDENQNLIK